MIVRALERPDVGAVHELCRDTLMLGDPVPFSLAHLDVYVRMCIGWYVGPGREFARVAIEPETGALIGYALVCLDGRSQRRWAARASAGLASRVAVSALRGSLDAPSRKFYRARLRDAVALSRSAATVSPHAHLNVARDHRQTVVARLLRDAIDDVCRAHDRDHWVGEINTRMGRRGAALQHLGFELDDRTPNQTLTELIGRPVDRLVVRRQTPRPSTPCR